MAEDVTIKTFEQAAVSIAEKVSFLMKPESYPHPASKVETKETHMSWVFLVNGFVYKLKKPVQYHFLDFRNLEARHKNCEEEVRVNKRLAKDIYVGIVPLFINGKGNLALEGSGEIIDWLVKMKRISENNFLDFSIRHKLIDFIKVKETAKLLSDFYINAPGVQISPDEYRYKLDDEMIYSHDELLNHDFQLSNHLIEEVYGTLKDVIKRHSVLFDLRITKGKIIEAHGDLRPEHVCLPPQSAIIDALEFNRELRVMDIAEELSFLDMECEMIGNTQVGEYFISTYRKRSGDEIPNLLLLFYKAKKAFLRTYLTARHLTETNYKEDPKWLRKANAYLQLSGKYTNLIRENTSHDYFKS
jgi:aminoglycoside phosphotransferase family enzyme